ncbi:MAG TPA: hypothetical protein VF956_07645 [Candidatus Dormibacteraeota bacterium]
MTTRVVTSDPPDALGLQMRALVLLLLMVATAACGAYRFPGESPSASGTVSGHVMAVPCTPVQPVNQPPCAGRPVAGLEIDFTGGGASVSARTDSNGAYSVELAAGTWKVSLKSYMRIISGPPTVAVQAGSTVVANYLVDSGIRVPVDSAPQMPAQTSKEPSQTPTHPEGVPAA